MQIRNEKNFDNTCIPLYFSLEKMNVVSTDNPKIARIAANSAQCLASWLLLTELKNIT